MFSKDWLECMCQIASYETPARSEKEGEKIFRPEIEEENSVEEKDHILDIKGLLTGINKRKGE